MAEKKESLLAQRAAERRSRKLEMQDLRLNDTDGYVRSMENSAPKTMGASNGAPSSSNAQEKKDRQPSRLVQEMAAMTAKMNRGTDESKGKEKESASRAAREKDISTKREDKQNLASEQNFKMVANVFKDQSDRMIKAIRELGKPKMGSGDSAEGGTSLTDLYSKYKEHKDKKKAERAEAEEKKHTNRHRNRQRRGRIGGSSGAGGGTLGGSDLDFDFDSGDNQRNSRDVRRNRRLDRMRNARRAGRGGRIGGALNRARGFGSSALSRGGNLIRGIGGLRGMATAGKVLGGVGALAAGADAAYSAAPHIGNVLDSNADMGTRIGSGAHLAVQGAGGVIGGVLGGVQGAAYGAEIGNKVADGAEWVGQKIAGTGVGDAIGASVALALTPFSEDAREAVVSDFKNKILPAMEKTYEGVSKTLSDKFEAFGKSMGEFSDKLSNLKDGAKNAIVNVYNGAKDGASAVVDGLKDAGNKIADGYNKGGISGALQAVDGTATLIGKGFQRGGAKVAEGVANAGSSMRYANEKGSANAVDLAMGFSADKGFKGMTDSQSKAYAGNVMKTESGGKLGITNQYGFAGQYQFGADALADNGLIDKDKLSAAKKAAGGDWYKGGLHKQFMEDNTNWKNEGGREAFLKDKSLQDNTFVNYTNKNIEAGYKSGALTANSSAADIAGYAKASHLKGTGGANDYFLRGKDSTDANGTRVSEYSRGASESMTALAAKVDDAKAKGVLPTSPESQLSAAKVNQVAKTAGSVPNASAVVASPASLKAKLENAEGKRASNIANAANGSKAENTIDANVNQIQTEYSPAPSSGNATAVAQTLPMLAGNVPPEMKSVMVANQVEPAKGADTTVVQGGGSKGGGAPTLDEMPMFINDMGLVLLQTGHV